MEKGRFKSGLEGWWDEASVVESRVPRRRRAGHPWRGACEQVEATSRAVEEQLSTEASRTFQIAINIFYCYREIKEESKGERGCEERREEKKEEGREGGRERDDFCSSTQFLATGK